MDVLRRLGTKLAARVGAGRRTAGSTIRVCHLVPELGVGSLSGRVVSVCNRLNTGAIRVSCLCMGQSSMLSERFEQHVEVRSMLSAPRLSLRAVHATARLLRAGRVDLLHTHGAEVMPVGLLAAALAGVSFLVHGDHGAPPQDPRLFGRAVQLGRRRIDAIVTGTHFDARRLARSTPLDEGQIQVIPVGVDTDRFRPAEDPVGIRMSLGLDPYALVIGSVGKLNRDFDFSALLDIAARLARDEIDFRCFIVGEGPEEEPLRRRARELGLARKVLFAGRSKEVPVLLSAMDVFVMPRIAHGVPASLLEAMACGRAVVAARAGAASEVVADGETGLLHEAGDAAAAARQITRLAKDRELAAALGSRARQAISAERSLPAMVDAHAALYTKIAR